MSAQLPEWCAPGTIMVDMSTGKFVPIAKVLKNGNFKVEGSDQQYSPMSGVDQALATGAWGYNGRPKLYVATDARREELRVNIRLRKAKALLRKESDRLLSIARGNDAAAIMAEAKRMADAIQPEKETENG